MLEVIEEVKKAIENVWPAQVYYEGTPTGEAIQKLIDTAKGFIYYVEEKIGGVVK